MSKPSGSVPPHKHCPVCGISIAPSKSYCTTEHEVMDEKAQKRMRNFRTLTLVLMIVAMLVLVGVTFYLRTRA